MRTLFFLLLAFPLFADNSGGWALFDFTWFQGEKWSLKTHSQWRGFERIDHSELWLVSQKVGYAVCDNFSFGLNHTYLESYSTEWKYQHRIELEGTPSFALSDTTKLSIRNRIEVRKIEASGWNNTRYRGQFMAKKKIEEIADALFASEEVFYDFKEGRWSENRLIPIGLEWSFKTGFGLKAFYLLRTRRFKNGWDHTHVFALGASLNLQKVWI